MTGTLQRGLPPPCTYCPQSCNTCVAPPRTCPSILGTTREACMQEQVSGHSGQKCNLQELSHRPGCQ